MSDRWIRGVLRAAPITAAAGTVVKFGGSLLLRPTWPGDLRAIVVECGGPATVVVGGGPVVDGLRAIDAAAPGHDTVVHRLAIDAMGITARLAADATSLPLAVEPARITEGVILDTPAWLAAPGRLAALPVGWHVTSDSIAAAVAAACSAGLLLVKSMPPPAADLEALAAHGWVDDHFPVAAATLCHIAWAAPATISPTSNR